MDKIKLAVLFGGKSSEYSVSLHSAASAIMNMDARLYDLVLIGIDQQGRWFHYIGDIEGIEHDTWQQHPHLCDVILSCSTTQKGFIKLHKNKTYEFVNVDCIFPILHGKNGEDGTMQGLFALASIPYVGCDHLSSAISMDKEYTHIICEAAGIVMAPYVCVREGQFDKQALYQQAVETLGLPIFIKPANAGSSYGISKIRNEQEFSRGLNYAFEHDKKIILETAIDGFEVGTAVMGNDEIVVGEVDEIETHNDFFDFDAKYELENTSIHCPARILEEQRKTIRSMAKKIYIALGCTGLARVDLFLCTDGKVYFNELNTIPGFTNASRYPTMMKEAGIDFPSLINALITYAMKR